MFDKIKQLNDMRKQAQELQKMLAVEEIIGVSRNDYIKITMDGNQTIKSVSVSDEIVGNKILLEDSIKQAVESANEKMKQMMVSKMGGFSGLGNLLK